MIKEFMDSLLPVKSHEGNFVKVDKNFDLCTGKILWRLLVGSQTPQDDLDCENFFHANENWVDDGGFGDGLLMIASSLKYFFQRATGYSNLNEFDKMGEQIAQVYIL